MNCREAESKMWNSSQGTPNLQLLPQQLNLVKYGLSIHSAPTQRPESRELQNFSLILDLKPAASLQSSKFHLHLITLIFWSHLLTLLTSSDFSADGKYFYATLTTANHIAALDVSDLNNPIRLDDPNEDQPTIGPHYIKVTPDQKHIVVTDYFVQTGAIGVINTPSDDKALYIDINEDGSLNFNRTINIGKEFSQTRGGAKPHSVVVFDLTDPAKPIYY